MILSLLIILGVVVTIHELGHYLAGRAFGAAVESFSFGFGRSIFERSDSRNTRWRINWIPLGGFVKFVGEAQGPGDVGRHESGPVGKPYPQLSVGQRSIVSLAGPFANFILAIALFGASFAVNGKAQSTMVVQSVVAGEPAEAAGFQPGDILKAVNGKTAENAQDMLVPISVSTGKSVIVQVERDGELVDLSVVPVRKTVTTSLGQKAKTGTIGLSWSNQPAPPRTYNPAQAIMAGTDYTYEISALTLNMLGRMVTGKEPLSNLSGPVGMGDISRRVTNRTLGAENVPFGQRLNAWFWSMLGLTAMISVGIGLFNLLPLPILDGGHLVFNAYEAVTGKVLPENVQEMSLRFGLVLLLTMVIVITVGDIVETGVFEAGS